MSIIIWLSIVRATQIDWITPHRAILKRGSKIVRISITKPTSTSVGNWEKLHSQARSLKNFKWYLIFITINSKHSCWWGFIKIQTWVKNSKRKLGNCYESV